MKIVAFLQNQWFKNPDKIRSVYKKYPDRRNDLNKRFLFMGCRTGRILKSVFGDRCESIIWENASDFMGDHSASRYAPDPEHIWAVIDREKPDVILSFGKIAQEGLIKTLGKSPNIKILMAPHPTARGKGIKEKIQLMERELHALEQEIT